MCTSFFLSHSDGPARGDPSRSYLLLAVFDSQLQPRQVAGVLIQQRVGVVTIVEDYFQLFRTSGLVQEVLGKLLAHMGQLLVLRLELVLHRAELLQLPAELEGREEGVLAGEGDERGAGQGLVDVEAGARVPQAVHVRVGHALHAVAAHGVRLGYGDASLQEQFDDFVVVGVCGQDDGGDVRGEVGELFVQQNKWHLVQRVKGGERNEQNSFSEAAEDSL